MRKMVFFLILCSVQTLFLISFSRGSIYYCPGNSVLRVNASRPICYLSIKDRKEVYWKANEVCMKTSGVLATISDDQTHKYLVNLTQTQKMSQNTSHRFWFGLSDRFFRGEFRWARCQDGWFNWSTSFQKWGNLVSNITTRSHKRCVSLVVSERDRLKSGRWDIEECSVANYFICQIEAMINYTALNITANMFRSTPVLMYNSTDVGVTEEVRMSSSGSPLRVILIVMIALIVIAIALGLWYRKRHRDAVQRNLIMASGMPSIGTEPISAMPVVYRQPHASSAGLQRHYSNNSNRIQFLPENVPQRIVYCGQNIDVIEEDEEPCEIELSRSVFSYCYPLDSIEVHRINANLTPVESIM